MSLTAATRTITFQELGGVELLAVTVNNRKFFEACTLCSNKYFFNIKRKINCSCFVSAFAVRRYDPLTDIYRLQIFKIHVD